MSRRLGHDVAVVGGSLAGLEVARRIAESGNRVSVYERAPDIASTQRALIVTSRVRAMQGLPIDEALTNEIHRYELFADGRSAQIALSEPDLVIERSALMKALAARAIGSGVRLAFGHRFQSLQSDGGHLRLAFTERGRTTEVATRTVVAADGANSGVARCAGWPKLPVVPVLQAIVPLPADQSPDTTRVWFRPQDTRYFYWLIPESPTRGVLGLIAEEPRTSRNRLDTFLAEQRITPIAYQAARVPAYTQWIPLHRRVGRSDVFVVGDAAGHVKVSTVGGVHTGFRGARAVADLVVRGGGSERRALRRELRRHLLLRRILNRFSQDDYAELLSSIGARGRGVLATYSRDDSSSLLWNLAVNEPRLLLLGLRGLLVGRPKVQSSDGTRKSSNAIKAPTATIQPIRR